MYIIRCLYLLLTLLGSKCGYLHLSQHIPGTHPIPMAFNVQCYRQWWPSFVLPKREDFAAFILQVERAS